MHQVLGAAGGGLQIRAGAQTVEVAVKRTHVGGNGHAVVVQHHRDVSIRNAGVVEGFPAHAAGNGGVAGDGHHAVVLLQRVPGPGEAKRGANGGAGVARAEVIEFVFVPLKEAAQALVLAQGWEAGQAPGQQLVRVRLVAGIPYHHVRREAVGGV